MKKIIRIIGVLLIGILVFYYREEIVDKFVFVKDKIATNTYLLGNLKNGLEFLESDSSLISDREASKLKESFNGITGEEYQFDSTYYPYYGMLDSNEKVLYRQVYANVKGVSDSFVPVCSVSKENVKKVIEAVYNDHAELFWVGNKYSYKYTKSGEVVWIALEYNNLSDDLTTYQDKFNQEVNQVVSEAKKLSNNYEKELYVHDYLVKTVDYVEGASYNQSAYSALVLKKSVCAGYARSFQYIMMKLGIPSYYITGIAGEPHAWNIVKLGDGYYHVDVTWDDGAKNPYTYFNKTDSYFNRSHTREGLSLNLPKCNATAYQYVSSGNSSSVFNQGSNKSTGNGNKNSNSEIKSDNHVPNDTNGSGSKSTGNQSGSSSNNSVQENKVDEDKELNSGNDITERDNSLVEEDRVDKNAMVEEEVDGQTLVE